MVLSNDRVNLAYSHLVVQCSAVPGSTAVPSHRRNSAIPPTADESVRRESRPARSFFCKVAGAGRAAARDLGLPSEPIPGAAGHDAAVIANAGIPSAMIFIRK
jgi:hypothetical protein